MLYKFWHFFFGTTLLVGLQCFPLPASDSWSDDSSYTTEHFRLFLRVSSRAENSPPPDTLDPC